MKPFSASPSAPFTFDNALRAYDRPGHCRKSDMNPAWRHVGLFGLFSHIRGVPGTVCQEVCVQCGLRWRDRLFVPRDQPDQILSINFSPRQ